MNFVSQEQYKKAQKQVKDFEARQARYETFKKELGGRLQEFIKFNFKRKKNRLIFAGYRLDDNKRAQLLIGEAECSREDKFDAMLGKLISVRKALGLQIDDIVEIVEPKNTFDMFSYCRVL